MWNLKKLDVKNFRKHLEIAFPADPPHPVVTSADLDKVVSYYDLYEEKSGRPCAELIGEDTSEALRQQVHDAYGLVQDGRRLGALRSAIKLLAEECPYCGYGPIEELDHLLQRGNFKLFSIFPFNLVPCCGACNKGKRKNPSEHPDEHQVHVYLEDLSAYDFLRVTAEIDAQTGGLRTTYRIEALAEMPEDVRGRLVNHIAEFDLQLRYKKQVNIFLGEMEYMITSSFETGGAEALRRCLYGTASALSKRFGSNDWRTALMGGLAECEEFCAGGYRTALGLQPADAPVDAVAKAAL